ncbi:MAG: BACON domain-containing protein [Blastocatellia bacterium]
MEFFLRKRLPAEAAALPIEKYFTAREQMKTMPLYSTAQSAFLDQRDEKISQLALEMAGVWSSLGPGNIGGCTRALLIHPTNPQVMYAAGVAGGVWKTTNGGAAWTPLTDLMSNLAVCSMAMDPSNPDRLWTGGVLIFRTQDGAAHREGVGDSIGTGSGLVSAIAVAPTDSNYVLVGKTTGLVHRKYDALFSIDPFSPPRPDRSEFQWAFAALGGYVSGLAFDPHNKNIAYATVSTFGGKHVWRSPDAGVTWTSIDGQGQTAFPDIPAHCIVVDPTNTARLYVGSDLGVFVSGDGGANWAVEHTGFPNTIVESLAINTVNGVSSLYAFTHGRGAFRIPLGPGCNPPTFTPEASFGAAGGEGSLQVNVAPGGCPWRAESNADWITVLSGGGQASDMVRYQVAANTNFERRVGTVTVGGRSFSIRQEAAY